MRAVVLPVANGMLPRPLGGRITGVFAFGQGVSLFGETGAKQDFIICPWVESSGTLYPVGVTARVVEFWEQVMPSESGGAIRVLMATFEGREHGRIEGLTGNGPGLPVADAAPLDLKRIRHEYPAISGAGWVPEGGFTEFRGDGDVPVTIYGRELETGRRVRLSANLGGLVGEEQAHTIEHAVIRALGTYGLCTPRTLAVALAQETRELKQSVEFGMRFALPEIIGRTSGGACGNRMSHLARFYLAKDFLENISSGREPDAALRAARRSAMSKLTDELGLTTTPGLRVSQGLKKGMSHDDTPLRFEIYKKVVRRFPADPWG